MELLINFERKKDMKELASGESLEKHIFIIRGVKVMIDRDLAELYQVPTFALNQAVKRNLDRFPENFMFRMNNREMRELITNCDRFTQLKHSSSPPLAFTEYGIVMLSSVLRSRRAVQINIRIIRTFIRLREWAMTHKDLAEKITKLEKKYDSQFKIIFDALREIMTPPEKTRRTISFNP